ncbi:MAG: leucine-rich repeat protein, partial [Bacteroidaceae bacterium]|nr:leucine-rich repeat protein [Bacteroidaceae bacterium]
MKTKIFNHSLLRLVLVGVLLMGSVGGYAQKVKIEKLSYYIDEKTQTARLLGNKKFSGYLVIPEKIVYKGKSYSVIIVDEAFYFCKGLTSVYIGNSVTSIGRCAFDGCTGLTSVTIGNSVTSIGSSAFYKCTGLTSVTIGNSVTSIGSSAFAGCSGLTSVTIPNSVTSIGSSAFYKCTGLTSVNIGNSVTSIGNSAFCFCEALTSVTIPNSVRSIGESAFSCCTALKTVKGLNSTISIGGFAFRLCPFYDKYLKSFDYHANNYILPRVKEWQQKKEYETTAQYRARVTKENQEKKIAELMQEAIKDYTTKNPLKVDVGAYDADYELYALNSNYGKKHVKIPLSEAPKFRENFKNATFTASYIATEEGLQISDLDIALNGKTYHAEQSATELAATTLDIDLPEVEIPLAANPQGNVAQQTPTKPVAIDRSIDQHIPTGTGQNAKTFAVIIGNEKYTQVAQVPYAQNDAKVFAEYCKRTLGLPDNNVRTYDNATFGTMLAAVNDVKSIVEAYKGDCNV